MSSSVHHGLNRFKTLYLSSEGADVFFKFQNDRIPAHKLILTTMSPWLNTMFFGSLPEGSEVDMTNAKVTVDAFKEFLQFFYMDVVNLTIENIEGVIDLAKQSLTDHIFVECENFLIKTITTETMCFGYELALRYGANNLKSICEDEICVNAEKVLRSSSFMEFPYEFLDSILKCDALACEEKDVFDACIAWAKAACKRNEMDPSKPTNLRDQLKDSVYQIRFVSMTMEEIASCVSAYPNLFLADELEEIICMNGKVFQAKKFNWTPRYFNLQWDKGRHLECNRFKKWKKYSIYQAHEIESLKFTTNRRVLLNGFNLECGKKCEQEIDFVIIEMRSNGEESVERYSQKQLKLNFLRKRCLLNSYIAPVKFNKAILLRPKYLYEIRITIKLAADQEEINICNEVILKANVLVDLDIMLKFDQRFGIISSLSLIRFDNKRFVHKLVDNPKTMLAKLL